MNTLLAAMALIPLAITLYCGTKSLADFRTRRWLWFVWGAAATLICAWLAIWTLWLSVTALGV